MQAAFVAFEEPEALGAPKGNLVLEPNARLPGASPDGRAADAQGHLDAVGPDQDRRAANMALRAAGVWKPPTARAPSTTTTRPVSRAGRQHRPGGVDSGEALSTWTWRVGEPNYLAAQTALDTLCQMPRAELVGHLPGALGSSDGVPLPAWWERLAGAMLALRPLAVDAVMTVVLQDPEFHEERTHSGTMKTRVALNLDTPNGPFPMPRVLLSLGVVLHNWSKREKGYWDCEFNVNGARFCVEALLGHHLWHLSHASDALQHLQMLFCFERDAMIDYLLCGFGRKPHTDDPTLDGETVPVQWHTWRIDHAKELCWWMITLAAISSNCLHELPEWVVKLNAGSSAWLAHDPWNQSRSAALLVAVAIRCDAYESLEHLLRTQQPRFVRLALGRTPEHAMGIGIDRWSDAVPTMRPEHAVIPSTETDGAPREYDPLTWLAEALEDELETGEIGAISPEIRRYVDLLRWHWHRSLELPETHRGSEGNDHARAARADVPQPAAATRRRRRRWRRRRQRHRRSARWRRRRGPRPPRRRRSHRLPSATRSSRSRTRSTRPTSRRAA